jgi:hypothetical protein
MYVNPPNFEDIIVISMQIHVQHGLAAICLRTKLCCLDWDIYVHYTTWNLQTLL